MQVAPSASTYAPAPGDLTSLPAPGSARLFPDQPQDNASAFTDSGPGGYGQPDPQNPQADPALASTSLFAPTDHTPSTTLALMVQAQTKLLLAEPANQEMVAQFGPPLRPLNTDTNVGQGILARFGPDLGARLTQLQEAQDGVRNQYLHALDQATQNPGPDTPGSQWVPG